MQRRMQDYTPRPTIDSSYGLHCLITATGSYVCAMASLRHPLANSRRAFTETIDIYTLTLIRHIEEPTIFYLLRTSPFPHLGKRPRP